jgi:hypothetical protein
MFKREAAKKRNRPIYKERFRPIRSIYPPRNRRANKVPKIKMPQASPASASEAWSAVAA